MPAVQNYIQSANAYQVGWAAPQRSWVMGKLTTANGQGLGAAFTIFAFDMIVLSRGGNVAPNVIAAYSNNVAFGTILTVFINLGAGAGVSTFTPRIDLGDAVTFDLPAFNLIPGNMNIYTSPELPTFLVYGRIQTTNAALVTWHAQMTGY